MKPPHRFFLLMLTSALLALVISLPATNSTQAAASGQSADDRIRATLEDAATSLGGGFEFETIDEIDIYVMERTTQNVGFSVDDPNISVYLTERLYISFGGNSIIEDGESWTFHGMTGNRYIVSDISYSVSWRPVDGLEIDGHSIALGAFSHALQSCPTDAAVECGNWDKNNNMGAVPLAEVLHQAALKNGLYEPMPEEIQPVDAEEIVPDYSEIPTDPTIPIDPDQTVPTETDGLFDVPLAVILGSLGIPIAGAIAGTVLSTLLSGSSAATSSAPVSNAVASASPATMADPVIGNVNQQGQYWSERPWDEAGPGFVPKEEFERTKDFLEKGYKWDHGNWRAPEEIRQNEQWEQNDRDAVAREDSAQRAKMEEDRKASQEENPEPTQEDPDLLNEINLFDLKDDLDLIDEELKKDKNYVLNPYQGDPTLIVYGLNSSKNIIWDNTAGLLTGDQGLTCEGYVKKTYKKVTKAVSKRFPGAKIEKYVIEEKSSVHPKGALDWFDSLASDNHNLIKVTLPDGSEWAVDFHQKNAGKSPILRPWSETRRIWEAYMGDEYMEGPLELR